MVMQYASWTTEHVLQGLNDHMDQYHAGSSSFTHVMLYCKAAAVGTDLCSVVVWWGRCNGPLCSSGQRSSGRKLSTALCSSSARSILSPLCLAPRCRNRCLLCRFHSSTSLFYFHTCRAVSHHLHCLEHNRDIKTVLTDSWVCLRI